MDGKAEQIPKIEMREDSWQLKYIFVVVHVHTRLEQRGRTHPPDKRTSSATLDAQSTVTELDRDRDIRRNVPVGTLLAQQPKAREKAIGRRTTASQVKVQLLHIGILYFCIPFIILSP